MSYFIKIERWTGQNSDVAIARFAKVFRMSGTHSANIMRDIQKGETWQFDKTVSPSQSDKARSYLQSLGYQVQLISADKAPEPAVARRSASETLGAPTEPMRRKSPFDFLKKMKFGRASDAVKKTPPPPAETAVEKTKSPKKSFLDFLKKGKADPVPEIAKAAPPSEPEEAQFIPLPRKSFLDFLKKGKTSAETEKPAPQAHRRKSNMAPALFLFVVFAGGAALPYFFGVRAEAILNEIMPRVFQKGVVVKLKSYDRGWLKSNAEYLITAPNGQAFPATSDIEHGPVALEELLDGNFSYFQARIESKIPSLAAKNPDGTPAPDPLESLVMKGYFVKKGKTYQMSIRVLDEGLNVNGKLIPNAAK